jgi:DNA-binding XRE family transcriptional regulator
MNAYSKIYLEDAMNNLAVMLDYGGLADGDSQRFFDRFVVSSISKQFEKGNPKYIAGYSGIELAELVLMVTGAKKADITYSPSGRSPEYWSGWALAYLQWHTGISFERLANLGVNINTLIRLYPTLHEADITKVAGTLLEIIERNNSTFSPLKRQRKLAGLTQKQLAEHTGVKIRMIQAYEQNDQDISKAEVSTVLKLARCLGCSIEDLICVSYNHQS